MRKIVTIALLLSLPATAQDWFEYRAETHSCWLPKPKVEWKRWERDGDVYRCPNSPVVVSRAQVQTYLQGLSRAHNEPECGPDAVQRAKDRVASDFGIRDDVLDLESRISPDSILQSYQNSFPSLSTGWTERKLTLEGQPFRVKSLLDLEENPRTYICRDDDTSDCVCSFATLDFLRILSDAEPGAEIDYYVGQNDFNKGKDYWASLAQLQEQPNFQEWQSTFSLQRAFECNLQTLASGKGDWRIWLAPRENRGISRISWHISSYKPGEQPLPLAFTLEYYRACQQRLIGVKWLQEWLHASEGRSIELDIVDQQPRPNAAAWKAAGLPGEPGFQLRLHSRDGDAGILLSEMGGPSLITDCSMKEGVPWSGHGMLQYGQALWVTADGHGTLCPK